MKIEIELRAHNAIQSTALGPVEIQFQWYVMAKTPFTQGWIQIGYIGLDDSSPFCGIDSFRRLPDSVKEAVIAELEKVRGAPVSKVSVPPPPVVVTYDDEPEETE